MTGSKQWMQLKLLFASQPSFQAPLRTSHLSLQEMLTTLHMLCYAGLQLKNIRARNVPDAQHAVMRLTGLVKLTLAAMDTTNEARALSVCSSSTCSGCMS